MTEYITTQLVPARVAALLFGLLLLLAHQQPLHAAPAPPDTVRLLRWLKTSESLISQAPPQALALADSAQRLAHQRGLRAWETRALLALATTSQLQADYSQATAFAQQAYTLARQGGKPSVAEWNAVQVLAIVAYYRQRFPEAIGYMRQNLALAEKLNDELCLVRSLDALGSTLSELKQYAEADGYLRRALAGCRRLRARNYAAAFLPRFLYNLAYNEFYQNRLPAALVTATQSLGAARQQIDSSAVALALGARALFRSRAGQHAGAVADGEAALRLALRIGNIDELSSLRADLPGIYERAGRLPEALAAERVFRQLNDSIRSTTVEQKVTELNTKFGVEQQKTRIKQLTQQQRIEALRADKARAQARLWGFAALALALGLAVGGWLLRQVRRSRAALAVSEAGLRAANTTQNQLMRIIGHDLRGPLAAFQQLGPVLAELADAPDPTERRFLANAFTDQARAVGELVDNLLHWSRAQAGQVQAVGQWVAPVVLARSLERLLAPVAAAKGVALTITCAPATPAELFLDPNLLGAILRNLLGNALKFTPAGGRVTLDIAPGTPPVAAVLTVTDTGLGMPTDRLVAALGGGLVPSTAGTNGEPGTGLGLAVCRHFAHLLGAEWRGESVLGQGTRFTLVLPTQVVVGSG